MRFVLYLLCFIGVLSVQLWGISSADAYMCGIGVPPGQAEPYDAKYRSPSKRVVFVGKLLKIKKGMVSSSWKIFVYEVEEVFQGLRAKPGDVVILRIDDRIVKYDLGPRMDLIGQRHMVKSDRQLIWACDGAWFSLIRDETRIKQESQQLRETLQFNTRRRINWKPNWVVNYYIQLETKEEHDRFNKISTLVIVAVLFSLMVLVIYWILRIFDKLARGILRYVRKIFSKSR